MQSSLYTLSMSLMLHHSWDDCCTSMSRVTASFNPRCFLSCYSLLLPFCIKLLHMKKMWSPTKMFVMQKKCLLISARRSTDDSLAVCGGGSAGSRSGGAPFQLWKKPCLYHCVHVPWTLFQYFPQYFKAKSMILWVYVWMLSWFSILTLTCSRLLLVLAPVLLQISSVITMKQTSDWIWTSFSRKV